MPANIDIPCPVCGSETRKIMYPDTLGEDIPAFDYDFKPEYTRTYQIVRCGHCGHAYSSPLPKELWKYYIDPRIDQSYLKNQEMRLATAEKTLRRIKTIYPAGKLLDIGCATGDFLTAAKKYYDVEGLELSPWSAKIASDRGLTVHTCVIKEMSVSAAYDIITLWGVIEHFENPKEEVEHIARLLKPGGIVCVWTGDVDSLIARFLGKKWWGMLGQHIQFFSQRSLRYLFTSQRFKTVWKGRYPYVMTPKTISQSLGRYPVLSRIVNPVINLFFSMKLKITMSLPGEMFIIFEKTPA